MMTLQGGSLYAYLQTRPGLTALVGNRVYPRRRPSGAVFPLITYTRIDTRRGQSHTGPDGLAEPRIQFDIWAADPDTADAVAEQLRLALNGYRGQMGDVEVGSAFVVGEHDDDEPELGFYRRVLDVQIQHAEAVA